MNTPPKPKVLVVESDLGVRLTLKALLSMWGYAVTETAVGEEAIARGQTEMFDVILTDLQKDGADGLKVLKAFREKRPPPRVIVMTRFSSVETAVTAMKAGAFNYISKPFKIDELRMTINLALKQKAPPEVVSPLLNIDESVRLVGHSSAMTELYRTVALTSMGQSTVLLQGESGTGKELVARAIHQNSDRAKKNFVTINCAAIPDTLLESELFGYARGAHSTAVKDKAGLIEVASGGTLFLDEVGDMSLGLQSKFLRILEDKDMRRLGANHAVETDVRIITATNKDLAALAQAERFRSDLYYRLNVMRIVLPPLRDRKGDIPGLVEYFIRRYNALSLHKTVTGVSEEVLDRFRSYDWPGNVRELENIIERAVLINTKSKIILEDLPTMTMKKTSPPPETTEKRPPPAIEEPSAEICTLREMERRQILLSLDRTRNNVRASADMLGIDPRTLYRKVKEYGLNLSADMNSQAATSAPPPEQEAE